MHIFVCVKRSTEDVVKRRGGAKLQYLPSFNRRLLWYLANNSNDGGISMLASVTASSCVPASISAAALVVGSQLSAGWMVEGGRVSVRDSALCS